MSDTKHQRGLLVPMLTYKARTVEEMSQLVAGKKHNVYTLPMGTSSFKEYLTQDLTNKYIVLGHVLYAIQDVVDLGLDESTGRWYERGDGTYEFEIRYSNEYGSMKEALVDRYKNTE